MNFVQSLNQICTTNNYEDQDDRGRLKWYVNKILSPEKLFRTPTSDVLDKLICGHCDFTLGIFM